MDYDFFYNDEADVIKAIFDEGINLPPAIRDYSAGVVSHVSKMLFDNMYPSASDEDWTKAWSQKSSLVRLENYYRAVRSYPLSQVEKFTNVQRNMDISSWTYNNKPLRSYFGGDEWDAFMRGQQQFKGAKTVGDLMKVVTSSTFSSIMKLSATRGMKIGGQSPLSSLGEMTQAVLESMPYYDPGVDPIHNLGPERPKSRSFPYFMSKATRALNEIINPLLKQEQDLDMMDFGAKMNLNITEQFEETVGREFSLEFNTAVKPVAGIPSAYEITGLFTRTGRPFTKENQWMLEEASLLRRPGWKSVVVSGDDVSRLDKLFSHVSDRPYNWPGMNVNTVRSFRHIDVYREYFSGIPRDLAYDRGRVGYQLDDTIEEIVSRDRVYGAMPSKRIPTGQFFYDNSKYTTPVRYRNPWPLRGGAQIPFSELNMGTPRRELHLDPLQIKFLLGDYTKADIDRYPSYEQYAPGRQPAELIPEFLGGKAQGFQEDDPWFIHRREALRIFQTYETALTALPQHSPVPSNLSQFEAELISRESELLNQGMTLQHEDAWGMSRPNPREYFYVPKGRAADTLAKRMALELATGVVPNVSYNPSRYMPQQYVRGLDMLGPQPPLEPTTPDINVPTGIYRRKSGIYTPSWPGRQDVRYSGDQLVMPGFPAPSRQRDRATGIVIPMTHEYMKDQAGFSVWSRARWEYGEGPETTFEAIKAGLRTATTRWNYPNEDYMRFKLGLELRSYYDQGPPVGQQISGMSDKEWYLWQAQYGGEKSTTVGKLRQDYEYARARYNAWLRMGKTPSNSEMMKTAEEELLLTQKRLQEAISPTEQLGRSQSAYPGQAGLIRELKVGDIFSAENNGESISLRVTRAARLIDPTRTDAAIYRTIRDETGGSPSASRFVQDIPGFTSMQRWSEKEGWDTGYGQWTFEKRGPGYQIEYELARNPSFPDIAVARVSKARIPGLLPRTGETYLLYPPDRNVAKGAVGFQKSILLGGTGEVLKEMPWVEEHYQTPDQVVMDEKRLMSKIAAYVTGQADSVIDPYNAAVVATINLRDNPRNWIARNRVNTLKSTAMLQAADYFMKKNARRTPQPEMPDDPVFEEGAYAIDPRPQRENDTADRMNALQQRALRAKQLIKRKKDIYFGKAEAITPREIEPVDTPSDVLSEEQAFAGTSAKGIAIGNYGYIRGEFLTMDQLSDKYSGRELLQNAYQVGRIAASHEIGHIVFSKLSEGAQKRFSNVFNFMVNKLGQNDMLSVNVKPENFNFKEEFSAAYSIAATLGSDALKEFYPEYSKYFADYWEEIEKAEEGTTVVYYKGDKKAAAFRAKQLQIHGELPMVNPDDFTDEWNESQRRLNEVRFNRPIRNPQDAQQLPLMFPEDMRTRQGQYFLPGMEPNAMNQWRQFGQAGQSATRNNIEYLRDLWYENYPEVRRPGFNTQLGRARIEDALENVTAQQLHDWSSNAPRGNLTIRDQGLVDPDTGQVFANKGVVKRAQMIGQTGVEQSLRMGGMPEEQSEWAATLLDRTNKWIEQQYKEGLRAAGLSMTAEVQATLKRVSKGVAEGLVKSAADLTGEEMQKVKDLVYGAQGQAVTPEQLSKIASFDPLIQERVATGDITEDMLTGPQRIVRGRYGSYKIGGEGRGTPIQGTTRGLWGGKAGALMYSSYIMRRMWTMISAPEFQAAGEYGAYLSEMAPLQQLAMGAQAPDLAQTDAGFASRQAATQRWMQRGAYQAWGGFSDAGYALSGSGDTIPRIFSALKVATGIGVVGSLAGSSLSMMGTMMGSSAFGATVGSIGAALPIAGLAIGGAVALGTLGMEAYNAIAQPETPMSWGTVARDVTAGAQYNTARQRLLQSARPSVTQAPGMSTWDQIVAARGSKPQQRLLEEQGLTRQDYAEMGITEEAILAEMTPQAAAMYKYKGQPKMMRDIMTQLEAVEAATGEDVGEMQAAVRTLARGLKGVPKGLADISVDWAKIGLTVAEGTQAFVNLASQMGYTPGTGAYRGFWEQYNSVASSGDVTQFEQMMSRGQRVAQFGGQITGFFKSNSAALQLTDKYDLTTAAKMTPVQGMLSMAAQAGVDADTVVAYNATERWEGRSNLQKVTFGETIAQMSQRRGAAYMNQVVAPVTSALIASGYSPVTAPYMAEGLGLRTSMQAQAAGQWLQTANLYGQGYGQAAPNVISGISNLSNFQASLIPSMAEPAMRAGIIGAMPALAGGMGVNVPDNIAFNLAQGAGGNVNMLSYLANRQMQGQAFYNQNAITDSWSWATGGQPQAQGIFTNPYQWMSQDMMGQPIGQTNFGAAVQFGAFWEQRGGGMPFGVASFQNAANLMNLGRSPADVAMGFFQGAGVDITAEEAQAWGQGSLIGATQLHLSKQREFAQRSANLAGAGAALSARFLWGGGAWTGTPQEGSIWAIQDTLRAMGNQNQLQNFQYQRQMMQTQNQFAIQQEQISGTRMDVSQTYNRWQMGFQYQGMMQQRQWARQDWQFQDTQRNMQFGWQMEDLDEAIRTSSGRQRAQLVRQRDRAATTFNIEGERIDETRSRQEELWGRQDEQFSKQQEYQETMMQLDEEQFELQKEQRATLYEMESRHFQEQVEYYKERYAVETELIAKQRDYQAEQIALQGAQAALQKEMAEEQERYNAQVQTWELSNKASAGYMKTMVEAEPEIIFKSFSDLIVNMKSVSGDQLGRYTEAFNAMDAVSTNTLYQIQRTMEALNSISPTRMQQLANALWNLSDAQDGVPGGT